MSLFVKPKRNWLIMVIPNYGDPKPDDIVWSNATFDQEQSPGRSGGTLARKLLTKEEAYAAAERLADNEQTGDYVRHSRYYPIEVNDCFHKVVETSSKVVRKEN